MTSGEKQYDYLWQDRETGSQRNLGVMAAATWKRDPKRLTFVLARYKFVSKMYSGLNNILEVGCGDAWASEIVKRSVQSLSLSDFDEKFILEAKNEHGDLESRGNIFSHNFCESASERGGYDGIYMLDVFEHINPSLEDRFIKNLLRSLKPEGSLILGCPSLESQYHISEEKRDPGHVNCKNGLELKKLFHSYFYNVFLFGMNDEVLLTSPPHMAFYNIILCVGKKC